MGTFCKFLFTFDSSSLMKEMRLCSFFFAIKNTKKHNFIFFYHFFLSIYLFKYFREKQQNDNGCSKYEVPTTIGGWWSTCPSREKERGNCPILVKTNESSLMGYTPTVSILYRVRCLHSMKANHVSRKLEFDSMLDRPLWKYRVRVTWIVFSAVFSGEVLVSLLPLIKQSDKTYILYTICFFYKKHTLLP